RARFAPLVCALDGPGKLAFQLSELGVPLTVFGRRQGIDLQLAHRLSRWMVGEQIDLVHTHNAGPHFYGAVAAKLAHLQAGVGPRVLHAKHGIGADASAWQPRLNQFSSWLSDRVIAVSSQMHEVALAMDRVSPAKLATVRNGVDLHEFTPGGDRR